MVADVVVRIVYMYIVINSLKENACILSKFGIRQQLFLQGKRYYMALKTSYRETPGEYLAILYKKLAQAMYAGFKSFAFMFYS